MRTTRENELRVIRDCNTTEAPLCLSIMVYGRERLKEMLTNRMN